MMVQSSEVEIEENRMIWKCWSEVLESVQLYLEYYN